MANSWESFDQLFDNGSEERSRKRSKTSQPSFNTSLRSLPHGNEAIPELLENSESTSREQNCAEIQFFNQRNASYWRVNSLDHVRPFDFPYCRALLQAPPNETLSPEDIRDQKKQGININIEVVTRKYEEEFLKEPSKKERRCAMDSQCQGLQIPNTGNDGFILKEFLLPSEKKTLERSGKYPKERKLCLMCRRAEIAKLYINVRAQGVGCRRDVILQDYRNLVGVDGEYRLRDCILSSESVYQGLLDPIVLHTKTSYRIARDDNGNRYYDQWKLKPPTFLVKRPKKDAKSLLGQTTRSAGSRRKTRSSMRRSSS